MYQTDIGTHFEGMGMESESIRIGGLFRCCIDFLRTRTVPAQPDERAQCPRCLAGVVYRGGAWEWAGPGGGILR